MVVGGSGQQWIAHLGIPGLDAGLFVLGQPLRLTAVAALDVLPTRRTAQQTFALTGDAGPLVFASNRYRFLPPDFTSSGISATPGVALCFAVSQIGQCTGPRAGLMFTVGGQQVTIAPAAFGTVGPYTIVVEDFVQQTGGLCESGGGSSRSAGFRN